MLRDLFHSTDVVESLPPADLTASDDGASADLALYSAANVIFNVGTITDGSFELVIEHSNDDGATDAYAPCDADDMLGTLPDDADAGVYQAGYIGDKRYIRASVVVSGAPVTGAPVSAVIVRAFPRYGVGDIA